MIAESIRISLPLVEGLLITGGAFVVGFFAGWWARGR